MLRRTVRKEKKFLFETDDTSICICHINYSLYILWWNAYRILEQYPPLILLLLVLVFGFSCGCILWMSYISVKLFDYILYTLSNAHIGTSLAHNCDATMYLRRLSRSLCIHSCNRWYSNKLHVFKAFVNDVTNTRKCSQCGFSCVCAWALKTNMVLFVSENPLWQCVLYVCKNLLLCVCKQNFFYYRIVILWIHISFRCFEPCLDWAQMCICTIVFHNNPTRRYANEALTTPHIRLTSRTLHI